MTESGSSDEVIFRPIGIIRTPFTSIEGMPIQPSGAGDAAGRLEVRPEYTDGLLDLDGFSHIVLLYHFHRAQGYRLRVVPFLDTEEHGLFATRAPKRPNPIGLSIVRLDHVEGAVLHVRGIDVLDGTPLLDIKPHVPDFDSPGGVDRIGWLPAARNRQVQSDDRFR